MHTSLRRYSGADCRGNYNITYPRRGSDGGHLRANVLVLGHLRLVDVGAEREVAFVPENGDLHSAVCVAWWHTTVLSPHNQLGEKRQKQQALRER